RGLLMRKKTAPGKAAAARRAAPKKNPTAGRRKPARAKKVPSVPVIPEDVLAAHFPAVEAAARGFGCPRGGARRPAAANDRPRPPAAGVLRRPARRLAARGRVLHPVLLVPPAPAHPRAPGTRR